FLHKAYLGQKRFSLEGNDALIPMLDAAIEDAAKAGAREVVIGAAHRGRLNILTHTVGVSYRELLAECEGPSSEGGQLDAGGAGRGACRIPTTGGDAGGPATASMWACRSPRTRATGSS